jgi:hypothetical protein
MISGIILFNIPLENTLAQELESTYNNQKCGVSINYPKDWRVLESDFVFEDKSKTLADFDTEDADIYSLNIGIDNSGLAKKSMSEISEFMQEFGTLGESEILSTENTEINGFPAFKIVYVQGLSGKYEFQEDKLHTMEVIIIAYNREYTLTFEQSGKEGFDKYSSIVEGMANSIKISQPNFEGINC